MPLRCLFLVQGEGRGHLTQALSLRRILRDAGHAVTGVVVGRSRHRSVPPFFEAAFESPVTFVDSPSFVRDDDDRSVQPWTTVAHGLRRIPTFWQSLQKIDAVIQRQAPDLIVNFFEPLGGLYAMHYRPSSPIIAVAHQYMFHHPTYSFPPGGRTQRWATLAFTRLTAVGASRRLALSLYPAATPPETDLVVFPPLLRRKRIRNAHTTSTSSEPFFLVYILNSGYAEEVIQWHNKHPDVRLHCFWDQKGAPPVTHYDDTLTFHQLDDDKFLSYMARSRGVVSTAGFESVAEAMYLGAPVQVVPVDGHYEQRCNAADTVRAGAGIRSDTFNINRLRAFVPRYTDQSAEFRQWVRRSESGIIEQIEAAANRRPAPAPSSSPVDAATPEPVH